MARAKTKVKVGRRTLEVSSLDKVLFPEPHVEKAALLAYYASVAPAFLAHAKGRPLSFVRFPDGIESGSFFQKNRPESAPSWIEHDVINETDYITVTSDAALVWLANMACIEMHQMTARRPHLDRPDLLAFDIDPPDGSSFGRVVEIAMAIRSLLEDHAYTPFVKTTGGKGVHVIAPIEPRWGIDETYEAAKGLADEFVAANPTTTTTSLRKESRKGRTFIDVLRNRPQQTIVCAYSLRGKPGAPVSTPLTWEELATLESPLEHTIQNVPDRLASSGDPWSAMSASAARLHTAPARRVRRTTGPRATTSPGRAAPASRTRNST